MRNKTWTLIKNQFGSVYGFSRFRKGKNSSKVKTVLFGLFMVFIVTYLMGGLTLFYMGLNYITNGTEMKDLSLFLAFIMLSVYYFIANLYKSSGFLFHFKDYDLLMALPVTERQVLFSKLSTLYMSNLLITLVAYAPAIVCYGVTRQMGPLFYVFGAAMGFFLPVIPMILGILPGLPIAYFSSRRRKSSLAMTVATTLFVAAIVAGSQILGRLSGDQYMALGQGIYKISAYYFPLSYFINALGEGSLYSFALFILVNLLLLFLFSLLYAKVFKKINGLLRENYSVSNYKLGSLKTSSKLAALYKKEIALFFSYSTYVVNTAIGYVLYLVYVVMVLFVNYETVMGYLKIPDTVALMAPMMCLVACIIESMGVSAAASINVEGQNLWVLKSLPVSFRQIALSKVLVALTLSVPVFLAGGLALGFRMGLAPFDSAAIIVLPCAFSLMTALLGVIINLHFPKLAWKNITTAVKQSMSVFGSMLISMLIVTAIAILYVFLGVSNFAGFAFACSGALVVLSWVLLAYIDRGGSKKFLEL